jgi:hypothetical protein
MLHHQVERKALGPVHHHLAHARAALQQLLHPLQRPQGRGCWLARLPPRRRQRHCHHQRWQRWERRQREGSLLLPPLLWIVNGEALRQPLVAINDWLVHRAEWLVGVFALLLGVYLAWQGVEGLHHMTVLSAA